MRGHNGGIGHVFEHEMEAGAREGPQRGIVSLVETPTHSGAWVARETVSDLVCLSTSGRQTAEVEHGAVRERIILHRIETRRFLSPP